ncbi:DUF2946 family protein [Allopusillimonas ginsengisoli]|uniref:DUF2946 family protein n=1 Tax=Allopusillimonas ginsengisoli TaxID=453575 RepID=UPI0010C1F9DE|nr:DUF2946 family protein [Allopusillimonas ginsengisoli]
MDKQVLAAMARWPDVPDVFGWLSLTRQGKWRLHPNADALAHLARDSGPLPGEPITSHTILNFINKNYEGDAQGRWYFQNGPQRVFVRLDAAPHILHTVTDTQGTLGLHTHNGLNAAHVHEWLLADDGSLYARTDQGPGIVNGRDLEAVLTLLTTKDDTNMLDLLAHTPDATGPFVITQGFHGDTHPAKTILRRCPATDIATILGFQHNPQP